MSPKTVSTILAKHKEVLKNEYSVKSIYLFGSSLNPKEKKKSDVDLLINFEVDISLFQFVDLKNFLEKILKTKVDLVTSDALVGWMRESIEKDTIRVA